MRENNISLNRLRIFEAAARHMSFTTAATELNVSQAAVSQQIRNLEDQLRLKLFHRSPRALSLTVAGAELSAATWSALRTINDALNNITSSSNSRMLVVSTLPSIASRWLIPRLDKFQDAQSNILLHIHTSESKVELLESKVDVAIRLGALNEAGLTTELLFQDAMCLVCIPELANEIGGNKKRLYDYTFAVDSDQPIDFQPKDYTGLGAELSLKTLELDRSKLRVQRFTSSDNVIQSALKGNSIALTRLSLCVDDLDVGRLTMLFNYREPLQFGTSLVYPQFLENAQKLRLFRDWLLAESNIFRQKMEKYLPD